ncbi:MAG: protein kinase domain-containing protein [Planctomycetota bacterium]|jgi:tetratricopeptide (TPR) repeat protein/predicted Ser/Thr protein kinase
MASGIPASVGPYSIIEELGRGGMGAVYRAHRPDLKRDYALKVILPGQDASLEAIERFRREAQAAAQLADHPGIVGCHDIGEADGRVYFAMDLVDGHSFEQLIDEGDLKPDQAGRIVEEAARALHFAHAQGVLHRDVKPANILVATGGQARIADFGLAAIQAAEGETQRLTQSGFILGTPAYMPPEQAQGAKTLDARADVYALGASLYEALTGAPPFDGPNVHILLSRILRDEPKPLRKRDPRIAAELEVITLKCLEKDPDRRYPTAEALAADLERYRSGEPILATPASTAYRVRKWVGRHRFAVRLASLTAIAAAALVGGVVVPGWLAERDAREANERALAAQQAKELAALRARDAARPHLTAGDRLLVRMQLRMTRPEHTPEQIQALARAAESEYERALDADPNCPEAALGIGRARALAKQWKAATKAIERAIALSPGYATAHLDWVRVRIPDYETMVHQSSDVGGAVTIPETPAAVKLRTELRAHLAQVRAHSKEDHELQFADAMFAFCASDYAAAANALGKYLELAPDDPDGWYWRGHALYHLDRFADARTALDRAIEGDADHDTALYMRGVVRAHVGDPKGAIADYTRSMRSHHSHVPILIARGSAWRKCGDLDRAITDYTAAIRLRPEAHRALFNRGNAWKAKREWKKAIADYSRAIELRPEWSHPLVNRGAVRAALKDHQAAVRDYDRAIALGVTDAVAFFNRARSRSRLGDTDGAIADYGRAIELKPVYPEAFTNRAFVRYDRKEYTLALADLDRALNIAPKDWRYRAMAERKRAKARAAISARSQGGG